jgi:hypothetical protein
MCSSRCLSGAGPLKSGHHPLTAVPGRGSWQTWQMPSTNSHIHTWRRHQMLANCKPAGLGQTCPHPSCTYKPPQQHVSTRKGHTLQRASSATTPWSSRGGMDCTTSSQGDCVRRVREHSSSSTMATATHPPLTTHASPCTIP